MKKIIGQTRMRNRLTKWYDAGYFPNVLFRGSPGMGKTLLALCWGEMIQEKTDKKMFHIMCQRGKLIEVEGKDIFILDEIHNYENEENLYNIEFGLIGCTTEGAPLTEALVSRFSVFWLEPYNPLELARITKMYAPALPSKICFSIALRCRDCPRNARKIGEELSVLLQGSEDIGKAKKILQQDMGIYEGGFTANDFSYMKVLQQFSTASIHTIASTTNIPIIAIREEVEPFLLRKNLIRITPRGRTLA